MTTVVDTVAEAPSTRDRLTWVDSFLFAVKVGSAFIILWGILGYVVLSAESAQGTLTGAQFRDLVTAGIAQGAMYGLLALGYSMVYGVLGFINFAHGEVFMSGAIVGFFVGESLFVNGYWESNFLFSIVIVLVVAVVTATLVAVVIERVAYRPLRNAPRLIPLITSIGVSFFFQNAALGLFGANVKSYPPVPDWLSDDVKLWFFEIEGTKLLVIIIGAVSMFGLLQFVNRTKAGRAMRAVAEDKEIAALMGIDVDRTIVTTFAVGGAMAGVAAVLFAMVFRGVNHISGFLPGIKAFTAAVLGGIGNLVGAMIGGLTLGVFESVGPQTILFGLRWEIPLGLGVLLLVVGVITTGLAISVRRYSYLLPGGVAVLGGLAGLFSWHQTIPGLFQLKDVVAFYALFLVLIFRPAGLLGERLASEERA